MNADSALRRQPNAPATGRELLKRLAIPLITIAVSATGLVLLTAAFFGDAPFVPGDLTAPGRILPWPSDTSSTGSGTAAPVGARDSGRTVEGPADRATDADKRASQIAADAERDARLAAAGADDPQPTARPPGRSPAGSVPVVAPPRGNRDAPAATATKRPSTSTVIAGTPSPAPTRTPVATSTPPLATPTPPPPATPTEIPAPTSTPEPESTPEPKPTKPPNEPGADGDGLFGDVISDSTSTVGP